MSGRISTVAPLALSFIATCFAFTSVASATGVSRTFVESTGVDGNTVSNCASSSPCRSFAAALTVTAPGGEIIALDTAGFGSGLTINQAVSIIGQPGGAEVTVPASGAGITISPGSGNTVILRNIVINGLGASSSTGIVVNSGNVIIQRSVVKNLTTGIVDNGTKMDIIDSDIVYNVTGISTTGTGVDIQNNPEPGSPGPTEVRITGGSVIGNTTAFIMNNPGTSTANPPFNDVTIFLYEPSGGLTTYIAANSTLTSGTGATCTNQAGNCNTVTTFNSGSGTSNQK